MWTDDVWLADSTPVECGRSRETAKRSELAGWASYGWCPSHSRWFWGLRLHLLCTLPAADADYATRIAHLKAGFSHALPECGSPAHRSRRERGIWQRRYWEHTVRDEKDLLGHIDYIHYNPVKHGYVSQARDWPWSSFHRFVANGMLAPDWAGICENNPPTRYGE